MSTTIVPEGRYTAVVVEWSTGASFVKGTEFVNIGFRIEEGEYKGRLVSKDFWLSERALKISARDLSTLGYEGDDPLTDFSRAKTHEDIPLPRKRLQVVIRHEEYNGNVSARVKFINVLSEATPLGAEQRASMKAAFAAARQDAGRQRAPEPTPIEDETPF